MPSQKLTELPLDSSPVGGDVLYIVTNYTNGSPTLTGDSQQIYYSAFTQNLGDFPTLSNNNNNSIVTATGGSDLNGESNLQFNGSTLGITGTTNVTGIGTYGSLRLTGTSTSGITGASVSTIISATKGTTQSIPSGVPTIVTGWTNNYTSNASEWNATTGTFTATKVGSYLYRICGAVTLQSHGAPSANTEYTLTLKKNDVVNQIGAFYNQATGATVPVQIWVDSWVTMSAGNTLQLEVLQITGVELAVGTAAPLNLFTIEEMTTMSLRATS